jgi:hypothetical protein
MGGERKAARARKVPEATATVCVYRRPGRRKAESVRSAPADIHGSCKGRAAFCGRYVETTSKMKMQLKGTTRKKRSSPTGSHRRRELPA